MKLHAVDAAIVFAGFAGIPARGPRVSRRNRGTDRYFPGGRRIIATAVIGGGIPGMFPVFLPSPFPS
ncbi:MAG: hypothetical protein LBC18_01185 [Opitutaceae bacterium]|jgi:hypothetical protein|nr:hypothetical protein [Opitutaceae bacterium]